MKKTVLQISSVICLGVLILIASVSAKAQAQYRAHIPFNFTIGQKSYEAGDYTIDTVNSDTAHKVVAIRDARGHNAYLKMGMPVTGNSKEVVANLIFNRSETQYSLAVISTPSFIVKFSRSKAEERLARDREVQRAIVALVQK